MNQQNIQAQGDQSPEPLKMRLFRYAIIDGVRTLKDSQIAAIFEMARKENILPIVMYSDDTEHWNAEKFLLFMKNEARVCWLIFQDEKLAGWVWLDDFGHRTARIHFCFFGWLSKARLTVPVGREVLRRLLDMEFRNGVKLKVIRGETPAFNKLAARFLKRLGMKIIGEIPAAAYRHQDDTSYPMIYSYINREILNEPVEAISAPAHSCLSVPAHDTDQVCGPSRGR
jgi:ribosomal protein S18 acetylase RimI-like enzyme